MSLTLYYQLQHWLNITGKTVQTVNLQSLHLRYTKLPSKCIEPTNQSEEHENNETITPNNQILNIFKEQQCFYL